MDLLDFAGVQGPRIQAYDDSYTRHTAKFSFQFVLPTTRELARVEDLAADQLRDEWKMVHPGEVVPAVLIDGEVKDDAAVRLNAVVLAGDYGAFTSADIVGDEPGRYINATLELSILSDNDARNVKANFQLLWRACRVILSACNALRLPE